MQTWWIDRPRVLGGTNPTYADLKRLRASRLAAKTDDILVSLLDETEEPPNYDPKMAQGLGYRRYSIPILDFHAPTIGQLFKFRILMELVSPESKVLIHCQGGIGRTGTMGAAYWILKGMTPEAALERVRKARSGAVETADQENVLREFAARLRDLPRPPEPPPELH